MKQHMKKVLLAVALVTATILGTVGVQTYRTQSEVGSGVGIAPFGPTESFAQSNWSQNLAGTGAVGDMVGVVNLSADTNIVVGDLVETDTTTVTGAAGRQRLGVRKFGITATSRIRCLGIAVDNIPARRGIGRVLTRGYHPGAFVGVSTASPYAYIKLSVTVPGSFSVGDTTSGHVGYLVGRQLPAAASAGVRYKYRVWFWGPKLAGATL